MAQALGRIDWLKDDPDLIRHFRQTEVDGVVLYVADCVAYTEQQLGLDDPNEERSRATGRAATRNDRLNALVAPRSSSSVTRSRSAATPADSSRDGVSAANARSTSGTSFVAVSRAAASRAARSSLIAG